MNKPYCQSTFQDRLRVPASTSPTMQSTKKTDHASPAKSLPAGTPNRRVLGDVSPNVRIATPTPTFLKKASTSSPLKRSFTASMESGEGFRYLKKRKLSDDRALSQVDGITEQAAPNEHTEVPTEPNTPTEDDASSGRSSTDGKSFSSLINYDPSSQTSNLVSKTISNAEMLKLRLRVAMYKVRTNQIEVPFTDLKPQDHSRVPSKPSAEDVEDAIAALRKEAQQVLERQRNSYPKLLPAPVLKPTAYSSRMIYHHDLTSSPPILSPVRLPEVGAGVVTPQREVQQLSSPPTSEESAGRRPDQDLTSSVVKGRAAEDLLGLRNAV